MPLLSSATALAVYTISDPSAVTAEKLQQFAFRSIDDVPEERGWGWTSIEDMFDTQWLRSVPEKGEYMCFSLRADTRRVPSAVLRKHLAEALQEEEAKAASEGRKVSRGRKKELKELYASKLLHQTEPAPAAVDVAVNLTTGIVMVSSVSGSQLELFEQYFESSFGVKAERVLVDPAEGQNLLAAVYENALTVPVDGHEFRLEEAGQATLVHPETGASVSSRDETAAIDKARQAGLAFSRLKLRLIRLDDDVLEWEFFLSSDGSITGLKTPKVEKGDGEDAVFLEKLYLIGQVVDVLLALFRNGK